MWLLVMFTVKYFHFNLHCCICLMKLAFHIILYFNVQYELNVFNEQLWSKNFYTVYKIRPADKCNYAKLGGIALLIFCKPYPVMIIIFEFSGWMWQASYPSCGPVSQKETIQRKGAKNMLNFTFYIIFHY